MADGDVRAAAALRAARPPARRSLRLIAGLLPWGDAAALALAGGLASAATADGGSGRHLAATLVGMLAMGGIGLAAGHYRAEEVDLRAGSLRLVLAAFGLALLVTLAIAFLWDGGIALSRQWMLGWACLGVALLALWRTALALRIGAWRAEGRLAERIVILGAGPQAARLAEALRQHDPAGRTALLGCYGMNREDGPDGGIDDLLGAAPRLGLDAVLVALPWSAPDLVAEACLRLRDLPVDVRLAPDLAAWDLPAGAPRPVAGRTAVEIWGRPLRDWRGIAKRAEDILVGGALILLFAPVMLAASVAIRLDSPGPVLLRQRRYGFANEPIMVLKFRSMHVALGDPTGARATVRDDPRVTRVGRFLRRTSLDELPQLFNVVAGSMSLVGPRAHPVEMRVEGRPYEEVVRHYAARHRMKPGITGLAQVNGCRGLVDTREKAQRRLDYDLLYVESWSLGLDLRILAATVTRGFTSDAAF
jgi:polysaccharide biosynthesis protein PslA